MLQFSRTASVPITARAEYWLSLWDEKLRFFRWHPRGLEYFDTSLATEILVDELELRKLRSYGIRELLRDRLQDFAKRHPSIRNTGLAGRFRELANALSRGASLELACRAREASSEVTADAFSERLLSDLATILDNDHVLKKRDVIDLECITTDILVRLLRRGFGLRRLVRLPERLFSSYVERDDGSLIVHFPLRAISAEPVVNSAGYIGVSDAARGKEILGTVSQADRIKAIMYFLRVEPSHKTYIFGVDGIRGKEAFTVGDVRFYSPVADPVLTGGSSPDDELINRRPERNPLNAITTVAVVDEMEGEAIARVKVEQALDIIRSQAASSVPLTVRLHRRILTNPDFGIHAYHESASDDDPDWTLSANKFAAEIQSGSSTSHELFAKLRSDSPAPPLVRQLIVACHWYRKAHDSPRLADRLLFYWVTLEKLFARSVSSDPIVAGTDSTHAAITAVVPTIICYVHAESLPELVHAYVANLWISGTMRSGIFPFLEGPEAARFVGHDVVVTWRSFSEWLTALANDTPESRLREYVLSMATVIADATAAETYLRDVGRTTVAEIKMIYWLRNRLVHDAEFEHPVLEYYTYALAAICALMLRLVLDPTDWDGMASPLEILMAKHLKGTNLLGELNGRFSNLLTAFASSAVVAKA